MKSFLLWVFSLSFVAVMAADIEYVRQHLSVGKNVKGVFVTTNLTSAPFYLLSTNLDLPKMVGSRRDPNLISHAHFEVVTQFVPSMKLVDGRPAPDGFIHVSGRYGFLNERTITLTSFELHLSAEVKTKNQILSVQSESCSFQVSVAFAEECRRLGVEK